MNSSQTAILLILFNRPDLAKIALERLRESNRNIYIAIDGPRNNADQPLVQQCISLAEIFAREYTSVKSVKFLIHKSNLGCKEAVIKAIDWAFDTEERLIILEDDISFRNEFLETMDNWLEKFDDSKEIFHLNGYNPLPRRFEVEFSYLCRYTHVWGWATWRDRWEFYDRDLQTWEGDDLRLLPGLIGQDLSDDFCEYWNQQLQACFEGLDTWDIQWLYSQWLYGGFSLTPGSRLTGNLGFDSRATHTKQSVSPSRERQPASHNGHFLNPEAPVFDLDLNLKHDSFEHGITGRHDFLKSPTFGLKTVLARTYLYLLSIKLFYQLTAFLLRKINESFSTSERFRLVFNKTGLSFATKPFRLFLRLKNVVNRGLRLLIKVYKFLSCRILRK